MADHLYRNKPVRVIRYGTEYVHHGWGMLGMSASGRGMIVQVETTGNGTVT
jgi:hypothetical protein